MEFNEMLKFSNPFTRAATFNQKSTTFQHNFLHPMKGKNTTIFRQNFIISRLQSMEIITKEKSIQPSTRRGGSPIKFNGHPPEERSTKQPTRRAGKKHRPVVSLVSQSRSRTGPLENCARSFYWIKINLAPARVKPVSPGGTTSYPVDTIVPRHR